MAKIHVITIFATEIFFTITKSIFFMLERSTARIVLAITCFVLESLLGLIQTSLLATADRLFSLSGDPLGAAPFYFFIATELFSITTEGCLIRAKVNGKKTEMQSPQGNRRRVMRRVFRWISYILSISMIGLSFFAKARNEEDDGGLSWVSIALYVYVLVCNAVTIGFGCWARSRLRLRTSFGVWNMLSVFAASWGIANFEMFSSPGGGIVRGPKFDNYGLPVEVAFTPWLAGLSIVFFLVSALGMPDFSTTHAVQEYHVEVLEIVTLGMTGPVAVIGASVDELAEVWSQILSTILPQTLAVLIPFILAYLASMFKPRPVVEELVEDGDGAGAQGIVLAH